MVPFSLCNAPSVWQQFINEVLLDLIDVCVVIYLDNDRNAAGGRCMRAMENTLTHTHYTDARERGCRHQGGARCKGECKGEAAGKPLGLRKVSLNVLRRVRTQPSQKPTKTTTNTKHSLSKTNSN